MKIALSTRSFIPPLIGGVDIYAGRFGKALERRGFEVFYLSFNPASEIEGQEIRPILEKSENGRVYRFYFRFDERPADVFHTGFDPEMGACIEEVLREEKPDLYVILNFYLATMAAADSANRLGIPVAHIATDFLPVCRRATMIRWDGKTCQTGESIKSCSACYLSSGTLGRVAASALNLLPEKTLTTLADGQKHSRFLFPLKVFNPYWKQVNLMNRRIRKISPIRRKIDLVFTPTEYTSQVFEQNGFLPDQVQFLPFGTEPESPLASVQHSHADHVRFLFIGRLQPYKGAHLLVKAFTQLATPRGATLTVHGIQQDGYEEYYKDLVLAMSSNENIRFLGKIPPEQLGSAFMEADYFVLPSIWHENNPLILIDAIQSRTPVIASDVGGVTDFVKDGVNGLLFRMGDIQALQSALQRVIDQPELLGLFRKNSDLLSIDDYVNQFLSLCFERQLLPEMASG
jgi:glycosyltransferase involved in cell wall biosynthesis